MLALLELIHTLESIHESVVVAPVSADPALVTDSLTMKWLLTLLATIVLITSNLKHIPGVFSPKTESLEKDSMYECGFEPFGDSDEAVESHFILIGVLFVLFDLELVLLVPLLSNMGVFGGTGIVLVVLFLLILIGGLIYEWVTGILNWPVFSWSFPTKTQSNKGHDSAVQADKNSNEQAK